MSSPYATIRQDLLETIQTLDRMNLSASRQRLAELSEKLTHEQFNLVVMGQFKRGKSTFINALLGAPIVPTSIVPLTSIVTILRYGRQSRAVVNFLDDHRQEIPLEDIAQFVTEKQNPENKLGVREVEVYYPSDYLKDGLCIVDTPGVGSVFQHNTDVAYGYLPYADAGIFLVTPDPPMGESEHRFLQDVRNHVDKLFFVLNKADLVDETDLKESLAFTANLLNRDLERTVDVLPVSAKLALDGKLNGKGEKLAHSNFLKFERQLDDFLHRDKGKIFLQSVISSLLRSVADETMACKLEQEAARLSLEELTARVAQFENYAQSTAKDSEHQHFILEGKTKKLHRLLDNDLARLQKEDLPVLLEKLKEKFAAGLAAGPDSHRLESELQEFVFEAIKACFTAFRKKEAEKIAAELENIYLEIAAQTNALITKIVKTTADIFEVELQPFTMVETLTDKSDFYFLLKDDPDIIDLIQLSVRSALPLSIAKKIILKRMKATIAERFERHCGRVRYDLIRRIDSTSKNFKKRLNEKVDLTLATIREALGRAVALKNENEQEVSSTLSLLSARLSDVDAVKEQLFRFQAQANSL